MTMQQEGAIGSGGAQPWNAVSIEKRSALAAFVLEEPFAIVHFEAPWCVPCRELQELLERLPVAVATVDVERVPTLAMDYGVETLPTLVVFKDGDPVTRHRGRIEENELRALVQQYA